MRYRGAGSGMDSPERVYRGVAWRGYNEEALSEQRGLTTSGPVKQYTEYCFIING